MESNSHDFHHGRTMPPWNGQSSGSGSRRLLCGTNFLAILPHQAAERYSALLEGLEDLEDPEKSHRYALIHACVEEVAKAVGVTWTKESDSEAVVPALLVVEEVTDTFQFTALGDVAANELVGKRGISNPPGGYNPLPKEEQVFDDAETPSSMGESSGESSCATPTEEQPSASLEALASEPTPPLHHLSLEIKQNISTWAKHVSGSLIQGEYPETTENRPEYDSALFEAQKQLHELEHMVDDFERESKAFKDMKEFGKTFNSLISCLRPELPSLPNGVAEDGQPATTEDIAT